MKDIKKVPEKEKIKNEISIGKPIDNAQVYILGKNNELVPSGIVGEICVGGAGVARGYLNRDDLTGYISMNPLTAINLILIAIGILMINKDSVKSSIISKIIALVVIALMLLVFANIFSFTNFKADKILFNTSLKDNQMSVSTVFNILFIPMLFFLYYFSV